MQHHEVEGCSGCSMESTNSPCHLMRLPTGCLQPCEGWNSTRTWWGKDQREGGAGYMLLERLQGTVIGLRQVIWKGSRCAGCSLQIPLALGRGLHSSPEQQHPCEGFCIQQATAGLKAPVYKSAPQSLQEHSEMLQSSKELYISSLRSKWYKSIF